LKAGFCSIGFSPVYIIYCTLAPNGLRYLRWGGDGEAVQPEK